jgi:hypothetical protein
MTTLLVLGALYWFGASVCAATLRYMWPAFGAGETITALCWPLLVVVQLVDAVSSEIRHRRRSGAGPEGAK